MKKTKLIRGNAKRVIAVASAFMMTCSTVAGNPVNHAAAAYAKEAEYCKRGRKIHPGRRMPAI